MYFNYNVGIRNFLIEFEGVRAVQPIYYNVA